MLQMGEELKNQANELAAVVEKLKAVIGKENGKTRIFSIIPVLPAAAEEG